MLTKEKYNVIMLLQEFSKNIQLVIRKIEYIIIDFMRLHYQNIRKK